VRNVFLADSFISGSFCDLDPPHCRVLIASHHVLCVCNNLSCCDLSSFRAA
jgi:hypothetical protein